MTLPWLKKLSLVFFLLFICFGASLLKPNSISALQFPDKKTFEKTLDTTQNESLETFNTRSFLYYIHNLNLSIGGSELPPDSENPSSSYSPGAIHIASGYITQIVTKPPTSSVEYLADLGRRLHLVSPAYAETEEGSGYQGLRGVMEIWKAFRNIAYVLFVLIFVVVGFMIMFRTKLNPQTVVNLQLALPKLIITLILITFSYAIAGFILDLTYFLIYLAVNITETFNLTSDFSADKFFLNNIFQFLFSFKPLEIADGFSKAFSEMLSGLLGSETLAGEAVGGILAQGIVKLIISLAIVISLFKLLFTLIIAYVNIIIQVIFSPIMLLFNALPNANTFNSWLKNLIANAAAFPAAAIMILIGSILTGGTSYEGTAIITPGSGAGTTDAAFFTPPLINFAVAGVPITSIIGLGIILMLPQIVKTIQEALKAPGIPAGEAVVGGIAAAGGLIAAPLRARREALQRREEAQYQAQQIGQYSKKETP